MQLHPTSSEHHAPTANLSTKGVFDYRLDVEFLNDFYRDDLESAAMVFQLFMDNTLPEAKQLPTDYAQGDWQRFRRRAHKLKVGFRTVGLRYLWAMLAQFERMTDQELQCEETRQLLQTFMNLLREKTPIVKMQLERLNR